MPDGQNTKKKEKKIGQIKSRQTCQIIQMNIREDRKCPSSKQYKGAHEAETIMNIERIHLEEGMRWSEILKLRTTSKRPLSKISVQTSRRHGLSSYTRGRFAFQPSNQSVRQKISKSDDLWSLRFTFTFIVHLIMYADYLHSFASWL